MVKNGYSAVQVLCIIVSNNQHHMVRLHSTPALRQMRFQHQPQALPQVEPAGSAAFFKAGIVGTCHFRPSQAEVQHCCAPCDLHQLPADIQSCWKLWKVVESCWKLCKKRKNFLNNVYTENLKNARNCFMTPSPESCNCDMTVCPKPLYVLSLQNSQI